MGPPAIIAFIWDCVDSVCLCVRRNHAGVPPIACLIIDLLLFLGFGAISSVIAFTISKLDDPGFYFTFFQDDAGVGYLHVILGFGLLATVLHLTIIVMACLEVKGRRSTPPTPQIIYVQSNSNGHDFPNSHQQHMASWPADAPPAYDMPTQQPSSQQFSEQIEASAPIPASAALLEKKA
ncbi:hypothetical protein G7Z17_g11366 [Cylindrodendrum hubeiense]|uniref:Uncharacterized protein n=1 Tax=Cylindrodendrum hubeiense TaxID=595255 RepID=A0A9P5H0C3_9HYPO|nr:hypothetical protein G7Z17_g11366 [Cylindrodendrum hubeiense]